ncbi:MAG: hypothetical protein IKW30_01070 [Lachnospiraceae bacterium]|nr:hypothetical protein [Lachnospiraceae bacterium]
MEKKLDLRIQKTYLALHNAFTKLLEHKRFEDITVNELCDDAMIRRTTFYKHFADKYEYYTFYLKEIATSFHDKAISEISVSDMKGYFIKMTSLLIQFLNENINLMNNICESEMFPLLLNILSEEIAKDLYLTARELDSNMTSEQLENFTSFYSGGLLNMLLQNYRKKNSLDENDFLEILSKVLY